MTALTAAQLLNVDDLPTLPIVATQILQTTNNPRSGAADLVPLLEHDPTLAAKVLRVANSALYGQAGQVPTLRKAVTLVGFDVIRQICMSVTALKIFNPSSRVNFHKARQFDRLSLWEHSLAVSECAKALVRRVDPRLIEETHLAGLFHDLGKILMDEHCFDELIRAIDITHKESIPSWEAERRTLGGISHAELGAFAAQHWSFPPVIVESIRNHHHPERCLDNIICQAVAYAFVLCYEWELSATGEAVAPTIDPALIGPLWVSPEDADVLREAILARIGEAKATLRLGT